MPAPFLSSDDVADLGMTLRLAGYRVGPDQCIAAQRLMVTLAAEGIKFEDRRGLKSWLAPVFCTTAAEQAEFSQHYEEWLIRKGDVLHGDQATGDEPSQARSTDHKEAPVSRARRAIAGIAFAAIVGGASYSGYQIRRELKNRTVGVRVVDQQNAEVANASVTFRGAQVQVGSDGSFTIGFRLLDLPAKIEAKKDGYDDAVELTSGNYMVAQTLHVGPEPPPVSPPLVVENQQADRLRLTASEVEYLKQALLVEGRANPIAQPPAETTWQRIYRLHYRDLLIAASCIPLLITGAWLLWKHLPRLQLIRWKSQQDIRLETLRVRGSATEFFNSPGFRKIAQQLRRHRLTESQDLDPEGTVRESASRGGWFTPIYLWQQRLPDYLILIDRAGFRDFQGKLIDDFVRNLRLGRVEIDCYDFYSDPRTCYLRPDTEILGKKSPAVPASANEGRGSTRPAGVILDDVHDFRTSSRRFSLDDLLAKHPSHVLMIFSDASGFFSSITGKPQPWVDRFSQWAFRAVLLPEGMINASFDRRAGILRDIGFLTLPATEKGLSRAVDMLDSGQGARSLGTWRADSSATYPSILLGDDLRWMSDFPPKPAHTSLAITQLRKYLGEDGFAWLCACAVYPELSWDLTLYLGHELRTLGPDERRLAALLRLPWFRHGTMPNWLRHRLVDAMSVEERERVRGALWRLLETALEKPLDHFELRYATDEKEKNFYAKLKSLSLRSLLKNFLHTKPPESALRDYVFISVLHGHEAAAGLRIPDRLRRLWDRVGHPNRPIVQIAASVLCTATIAMAMYYYRPKSVPIAVTSQPLPVPTGSLPYHLSLEAVLGPQAIKSIEKSGNIVFQVTGDTGGTSDPSTPESVADAMAANARSFLYLLGNIVFGTATNYYNQFYIPYKKYPAPIFAIAGNRDATPLAGQASLDGFVRNFCANTAIHMPEAGSTTRTAMTEPNVYWTLEAPFATIIGLYSNVTRGGFVDKVQEKWLVSELRNAPSGKAVIIAVHHPIYSANPGEGGSDYLAGVLDRAMLAADRAPDLVLSAHTNNYQRFSRRLGTAGRTIPYLVVGTGGYPALARLEKLREPGSAVPLKIAPEVTLESFDDDQHGYVRVGVSQESLNADYFGLPQSATPQTHGGGIVGALSGVAGAILGIADSLTVTLAKPTIVPPAELTSFSKTFPGTARGEAARKRAESIRALTDRTTIVELLGSLEKAYSNLDAGQICALWTGCPRKALEDEFKNSTSVDVKFQVNRDLVQLHGDGEASAECLRVSRTTHRDSKGSEPHSEDVRINFRKQGKDWRIDSLEVAGHKK